MFSKSCEYAIQAVLYIGLKSGPNEAIGIKAIAESQGIPSHFLSKILQQLVKQKILVSTKGPNGGFRLCRPAEQLKLIQVVEQMDGLEIFDKCGIGLKSCSDANPCPVHTTFKTVKKEVKSLLTEKSVADLCLELRSGKTNLISF